MMGRLDWFRQAWRTAGQRDDKPGRLRDYLEAWADHHRLGRGEVILVEDDKGLSHYLILKAVAKIDPATTRPRLSFIVGRRLCAGGRWGAVRRIDSTAMFLPWDIQKDGPIPGRELDMRPDHLRRIIEEDEVMVAVSKDGIERTFTGVVTAVSPQGRVSVTLSEGSHFEGISKISFLPSGRAFVGSTEWNVRPIPVRLWGVIQ